MPVNQADASCCDYSRQVIGFFVFIPAARTGDKTETARSIAEAGGVDCPWDNASISEAGLLANSGNRQRVIKTLTDKTGSK